MGKLGAGAEWEEGVLASRSGLAGTVLRERGWKGESRLNFVVYMLTLGLFCNPLVALQYIVLDVDDALLNLFDQLSLFSARVG